MRVGGRARLAELVIGVVVLVPEPYRGELAALRRSVGDPQAGAVPPHITLLPPTRIADLRADSGTPLAQPDALERIDAHLCATAAAHDRFRVHLAGAGTFRPVSQVVFAHVATGISQCELLEADVRSGPLARPTSFPYHPHVTVAHDLPPAGLDAAYEGLSGFEARFEVSQIVRFTQVGQGWEPARRLPLRIP